MKRYINRDSNASDDSFPDLNGLSVIPTICSTETGPRTERPIRSATKRDECGYRNLYANNGIVVRKDLPWILFTTSLSLLKSIRFCPASWKKIEHTQRRRSTRSDIRFQEKKWKRERERIIPCNTRNYSKSLYDISLKYSSPDLLFDTRTILNSDDQRPCMDTILEWRRTREPVPCGSVLILIPDRFELEYHIRCLAATRR